MAATELEVDPSIITEATSFAEDLEADSLDLTELVMALEDQFDIEVPEDDLAEVKTVGDAADVVLAVVGSSAAAS